MTSMQSFGAPWRMTPLHGVVLEFWDHLSISVVGNDIHAIFWSSMADDAITWGGIGVVGSPFYICGWQ